ncbi:unnamed protein product [Rhizophagus irregularis]|nr:unnamed protein product [Rhizophagus irregularis]
MVKESSGSLPPPRTPPQVHRDLTNLLSTPNKRPLGNEEFQHYSQEISIICAFGMTTEELMKEIGKKLARELSTSRDNNPSVWTPAALERYIITTLKENIVLGIFIDITYRKLGMISGRQF